MIGVTPTSTSIRPVLSKGENTADEDEEVRQKKEEEESKVEEDGSLEVPVVGDGFEVRKIRVGRRPLVPTKAGI